MSSEVDDIGVPDEVLVPRQDLLSVEVCSRC